jgi:accessory colonization factor AcfC
MSKIILTAQVEDGRSWEDAFRTHGDMFKAARLGTIHYTIEDSNLIVMSVDVDDVGAYMDFMKSQETQDAMKNDGVKRDTVKLHVLDKEFSN